MTLGNMRGLRVCATLLCCALCGGAIAQDRDFQPHPSHQPPPPPEVPPPPPPPPKFPPPKPTKVVSPEYPDTARRYNAQVTVRVAIHVKANGSVSEVEALNGNPVFVDAVKRALKKWKFEKRPEDSLVKVALPFRLTGTAGGPSGDEAVRPRLFTPQNADDVKRPIKPGFMYVRLLIDTGGNVVGRFIESCAPADFEDSASVIIDAIRFAPAEPGRPPLPHTLNSFLVDYADDGVIRVQQRGGEPR
jgi:TonB family protein